MYDVTELANAVRVLSIDAVNQAQSGHPGMPLGMADIATVLWKQFLKHNPDNPAWFNRDRFVLSNGHGSMLLYALLHLTGYKLPISELKNFRQLHSMTPGHPEKDHTPGVETTTGPLGQGLANAVGMALAEKMLAKEFNKPDHILVDHHTYAFVGDGCLMEGISHEVCSLAGTLQLGKLIVFYDDNGISIDGEVKNWFSDDTAMRFRAYHWQVLDAVDGHDAKALTAAIQQALANTRQPTLIPCKTVIGLGSSVAGSEKAHGAPLSADDIGLVRNCMNWSHAPFVIPEEMYKAWSALETGKAQEQAWLQQCNQYKNNWPVEYEAFLRRINGDLPDNWSSITSALVEKASQHTKPMATRKASQVCIEHFAPFLPEMLGGSADLTGSNNTDWSGTKALQPNNFSANYIHYGVREFGMAAMMNGIALHGGFIPFGGTFLVFADYARNAIRLSALMKQRVIYIFSHDSIGLGEDGPTHQPVEQASMLRMTPNMMVWRPADLLETAIAWQESLENHQGPASLLLSRQNLPVLDHASDAAAKIRRGGYIVVDTEGLPDAILIATGSEVQLALAAAKVLTVEGLAIRVVSMPCAERFLQQDEVYRESVLPEAVRVRLAIEAAATAYWYRFTGLDGAVLGLDCFGLSAPAEKAFEYLGFSVENITSILYGLLKKTRSACKNQTASMIEHS